MYTTTEQINDLLIVRLHDSETGAVLHWHYDNLSTTSHSEAQRQAALIIQYTYDTYEPSDN